MTILASLALIHRFFASELGRVGASLLIVLACLVASRRWKDYLNSDSVQHPSEVKRQRLVWAQNTLWAVAFLCIAAIWASKLAGFALSLAALAGALLIVSKDLITCFLGYALLQLTRPYRIGDFIEVSGCAGRVIDMNAFSTTLEETGPVNQLTGKTLTFPNSLLLGAPVRNTSATGAYIVNLFRIAVPLTTDIARADECALAAAEAATAEWRDAADAHLEQLENASFLNLPSSRPKVLWESGNDKIYWMTIRFACPIQSRVGAEQAIFRQFWAKYRAAVSL